jgi:hypothetical protein
LALAGSFELLMMLVRIGRGTRAGDAAPELRYQPAPPLAREAPLELSVAPTLEQIVRERHGRPIVNVPSPANSTSTVARSNASLIKQHNKAQGDAQPSIFSRMP